MTPLENNTHLSGAPFPHPTVSFLRPISSPPTFLNTNTGCIAEHNEMEQDDNSNGNSGHNDDEDEEEEEDDDEEDEEEDNYTNEVNTLFENQRGTSVTNKLSVNHQLANPNLKNYQGTLTKSETNPIDINMEASIQDAIFDGEIEFITKEAFLKNITVANRHLCLVIDNPSLPSYIQGKVKEAIDLLRADEEKVISGQPLPLDSNIKIGNAALLRKRKRPKNKKVIKNKKTFTAAPETSLGIESNIITVNNPGIANSTQTVSNDKQANIAESKANSMHIPDTQEPQSMTGVQIPSQVETSNFLTCSNISHQPTNSNASGDPNNINSTLMVGRPDSNCTFFDSDLAINPAVTNSANTLIPKVPLSVPVSYVLSATLGSIYHLKTSSWNITLGSILALIKNRNSRIEGVELPNYLPSGIKIKSDYGTSISQWLKHLDNVGLDIFLAKSNEPFFSEDILNTNMLLDFNTPVGHLPKNIHDIVYIMQPICNPPIAQQMIWANLLFESLHLVARDIIAPVKFVPQQVTTENPLSVEYALAGFLASCFSLNKNRGAILPMEGSKANDNTIKDPAAGTFKNLDNFVDKIVHVLIAINMVQAHAKCQDNPAGPSSSIHPKRKGKASSSSIETVSSKTVQLVYKEIGLKRPLYCLLMAFCAAGVRGLMLGSNNWRKCGALESLQIITLSNEILKLKGNDFEEPYWPRTSKYIPQIIKSCFLSADPKSHKPMCPSRYEIAKCIVLDFGDTWHSKVDDSKKQHLSLPKKALVNAVISELS
ncbi:hypothetical protein PPACK8108_LOCUS3390 [Phakopsora pachyrhizi]|uniref:Uncharacterized protein n=1 Tax=Phakopsora pachyrhizi TaxID=170000 RepID=A0AAV0AK08_PHAPC|nr:hypothetical protein PPACK8108_LOCUS3390 [Phakopsora pachyrhizi]